MNEQVRTSEAARASSPGSATTGRSFMSARRSTSARAGVRLLTIAVGLALSGTGRAYELDAENAFALTGTWTAGPTRIVITADGFSRMYSWEESSTGGRWVNLNGLQSGGAMGPPVVVQTAAGNGKHMSSSRKWTHPSATSYATIRGRVLDHSQQPPGASVVGDGQRGGRGVQRLSARRQHFACQHVCQRDEPSDRALLVGSDGQVYGASGDGIPGVGSPI